jgi:hypothetical protein
MMRRLRLRVGLPLAVSVAVLLGQVVGASAQLVSCRTDPTVTLSNGVSVTMWATISTTISHVQSVNYVLHVPAGVKMTGISYDANGSLEHVQLVADQTGTQYEDITTVDTTSTGVGYTANATRQDTSVATMAGKSDGTVTLHWAN